MESIATELLNLLKMAAIPVVIRDTRLPDGSISRTYTLPLPSQPVRYHRNNTGVISVPIQNSECLVIAAINAFGINYSASATVAIRSKNGSYVQNAQPLQMVADRPVLYVFGPGAAEFSFVFTPLPTTTARVQVFGYILPNKYLQNLSRLAVKDVAQ